MTRRCLLVTVEKSSDDDDEQNEKKKRMTKEQEKVKLVADLWIRTRYLAAQKIPRSSSADGELRVAETRTIFLVVFFIFSFFTLQGLPSTSSLLYECFNNKDEIHRERRRTAKGLLPCSRVDQTRPERRWNSPTKNQRKRKQWKEMGKKENGS